MIPITLRLVFWTADKLKIKKIQKHKEFYYNYYRKAGLFEQKGREKS